MDHKSRGPRRLLPDEAQETEAMRIQKYHSPQHLDRARCLPRLGTVARFHLVRRVLEAAVAGTR